MPFADDRGVAWPVERDLADAQEQSQPDWQVEPVSFLLQIGLSEAAKRTSSKSCRDECSSPDGEKAVIHLGLNGLEPVPIRDGMPGEGLELFE
jgi:hypothetical protein